MSIIGFLFKSKNMAKKNTKDVRVGKYTLTKHAQHRIVDPEKDLSKHNVLRNLFGKSDVTKLYDHRGEAQYDRIHQKTKIVTHMTPEHRVKTIRKVHKPHKEVEKDGRQRKNYRLSIFRKKQKSKRSFGRVVWYVERW